MRGITLGLLLGLLVAGWGCKTEHKVTVDHRISGSLDINIKVDRELDRFFAFEEELEPAKEITP